MLPTPAARRIAFPILALALLASAAAAERLSFNRDVRPILSENCFQCHGPDAARREAELRLDDRAAALAAVAFVPGQPDESELVRRVFSPDATEQMPPPDAHRTLTTVQKETLRRWVREGAEYQPHWAFLPPARPAVPSVAGTSHPIDAFVRARLAAEQLPPAPEAERRTLIRRLSFDLTGLPPPPDAVEAFSATRDPQAYEKLVQRFLASPHFGERMAVPWLDLVRYADTIGFHNDVAIGLWPYRDYVIDAFNRNLPFDQFTREQLAGDLLPESTPGQRVGSAYNRLHRISGEGGIQDKEYRAKYAADRVRTTATVFLGVTLACAECHDHKFDPFTIRDFYSLAAVFADLTEKGAYNLYGGFTRENLSAEMLFASPDQQRRIETFDAEIRRLTRELAAVTDDSLAVGRTAWAEAMRAAETAGHLVWRPVTPLAARSPAETPLTLEADGTVLPGGRNPAHDTYEITLPADERPITAVRLESVADARFPGDEVARSGSTFFLSALEVYALPGGAAPPRRLAVSAVRGTGATELGHPVSAVADDDPRTALAFVRKRNGAIALLLAAPFAGGPETRILVRIRHSERHPYQHLGRFKLSVHHAPDPDAHPSSLPENVLKALRVPAAERKPNEHRDLAAYYRTVAPELAALREGLRTTTEAREYLALEIPSVPVSRATEPAKLRVLPRGNWMDDSGEAVAPAIPAFFGRLTPRTGDRVTRLDFADWLVSPENPLTARTFVNRVWRIFFGHGLVTTLEDLGSQGAWPSHPELLDWLAVEFRASGWNVKRLVALIVTSATYRQSAAAAAPLVEERDPANRLLARQNRLRLDAEFVRDNALAVSGLLVPRIGGPSVKPYQPEGYYAPLNFPRREYVPDVGADLHRRGLYTHWQRTFLHPSLLAFDAPAREECTAARSASNTPLQALVLLNDPTYVEAARAFAAALLREGDPATPFAARLARAYARALARPPTSDEIRVLAALHSRQLARYTRDPAAARQLVSVGDSPVPADLPLPEFAAWTAVTRAILNLHETITRN
jgi:mono/diheme cytochrome c family protein